MGDEKREFAWEFSQLSCSGQTRTRVSWELTGYYRARIENSNSSKLVRVDESQRSNTSESCNSRLFSPFDRSFRASLVCSENRTYDIRGQSNQFIQPQNNYRKKIFIEREKKWMASSPRETNRLIIFGSFILQYWSNRSGGSFTTVSEIQDYHKIIIK
jgi:hypothetical protein